MIFSDPVREMFGSALGIVAGGIVTIGAFLKAALGRIKDAAPPVEDYSGSSRAGLNVLIFAPLILALLTITPENALAFLLVATLAGIGAFLARQQYFQAKAGHVFKVPLAKKFQWLRKRLRLSTFTEGHLIGGDKLIAKAAQEKANLGCPDEVLLKLAGYQPGELWEESDRARIQNRVERWYFLYVFLAVMTLVVASLSMQAYLSGESPRVTAKQIWSKAHPIPAIAAPTKAQSPVGALARDQALRNPSPIEEPGQWRFFFNSSISNEEAHDIQVKCKPDGIGSFTAVFGAKREAQLPEDAGKVIPTLQQIFPITIICKKGTGILGAFYFHWEKVEKTNDGCAHPRELDADPTTNTFLGCDIDKRGLKNNLFILTQGKGGSSDIGS
ncbi:MAG: hypothetical protein RB191_14555 [Terriglobia bacterium]|nr:hypothetical protein [Terriglobia bacterium]